MALGADQEDARMDRGYRGSHQLHIPRHRASLGVVSGAPLMAFLRWIDALMTRFIVLGWALLIAGILSFLVLAADRRPPFKIISFPAVSAPRGGVLSLTAEVWRDSSRDCNATYSRYLFDSSGRRFDDVIGADVSDAMIDAMEKNGPGKLSVAVNIPAKMAPGKALMETVILYQCNKAHAIWPIVVTTDIPFTVE